MPAVLQITSADIEYAERILLPSGKRFDPERVDYIKNFETLDLQAVPGSGKTTALLAKLLILERYLPFADGSGVLVISHTNAAVDEIRTKIEKYCPRLFGYPNFVGTIQSFVDEFLARPYYIHAYHNKPVRIDNDTYLSQFYRQCPVRSKIGLKSRYRDRLDERLLTIFAIDSRDYIFGNLDDQEINTNFSKTTNTYQELRNTKLGLIREGYLSFNDAYCLAMQYMEAFPQIKDIMRKRFSHIFVDEMQDMDTHQYKLLELLFIDSGQPVACYQRIGDKNQAIFNGDAGDRNVWQDRDTVLHLSGSHRLSALTAGAVQNFALYPIRVEGLRCNVNGSAINIKPRIIVYDNATKTGVIEAFAGIIKQLDDDGLMPASDNGYYAISWNATWSEEEDASNADKLRLVDYYPAYLKRARSQRKDCDTLEEYVIQSKGSPELKVAQDALLRSILKVFNLEGIKNTAGRNYSKAELLRYLADNFDDEYKMIRSNLYLWSMGIVRDEEASVIAQVKAYLPQLLGLFGASVSAKSSAFINNGAGGQVSDSEEGPESPVNAITVNDINVNIATVHSVKGQTHTATLYLESFYYAGYESSRLAGQFRGEPFARNAGVRIKQAAKMVYVGLSRPTHLACFAVHRDRFDASGYSDKWEVIDITGN